MEVLTDETVGGEVKRRERGSEQVTLAGEKTNEQSNHCGGIKAAKAWGPNFRRNYPQETVKSFLVLRMDS